MLVKCRTFQLKERGIMKHNLTPEEIVLVLFGLLAVMVYIGLYIEKKQRQMYERGYQDGWRRAKATFGKGNTR